MALLTAGVIAGLKAAAPYVPQVGLGAYEYFRSRKGLRDLEQEEEPSLLDPSVTRPIEETKDIYERQYRQGLSPQERAALSQEISTQTASMRRQITESSPQMSQVVSRIGALDRVRGALGMEKMSQGIKRQAASGIAQSNLQLSRIGMAEQTRIAKQQQAIAGAYGRGMQKGLGQIATGMTYGLYKGMKANGSPSTTPEINKVQEQSPSQVVGDGGLPRMNYNQPGSDGMYTYKDLATGADMYGFMDGLGEADRPFLPNPATSGMYTYNDLSTGAPMYGFMNRSNIDGPYTMDPADQPFDTEGNMNFARYIQGRLNK